MSANTFVVTVWYRSYVLRYGRAIARIRELQPKYKGQTLNRSLKPSDPMTKYDHRRGVDAAVNSFNVIGKAELKAECPEGGKSHHTHQTSHPITSHPITSHDMTTV